MRASNESATAAIRDFNRFYTHQLGLLEQGLLGSGFTLTEVRVLYELATATAHCDGDSPRARRSTPAISAGC